MSDSTTKSTRRSLESPGGDLWLVVSTRSGITTLQLPAREELVVGRAAGCDVVVDDDEVSRRHAVLRGRRSIRDLGSKNGTTVGGRRLAEGEEVPLAVGSVVVLGAVTAVLLHAKPIRRATSSSQDSSAVVRDPTMLRLYDLVEIIAASPLAVLLLGETGTGKEVFAEAVHRRSQRARAPMLRLNCAGLTGSLLEAELFGYERGAFTGAISAKAGLFEAAHGGTMFLDEVGELPLETQAKLLRVVDTGEVFRLGSLKPRRVDVRYVAATNRNIEQAVEQNLFRQDLFFRLNGFSLTLPPLRRRPSEILPLAEHFLASSAKRSQARAPAIGHDAARALVDHAFPGNVRELRQIMERAFALARGAGVVERQHLWLTGEAQAPRSKRAFDLGREEIEDALRRTTGNQSQAAQLLGVARRTLINKIEAHGVARPRKKSDD
jgi:two-component system response regulator AtoC